MTEMVRIIKEEEPSKPSTRISTDESAPSAAALRHSEPKKLAALLRGEVDWVVMKAWRSSASGATSQPMGWPGTSSGTWPTRWSRRGRRASATGCGSSSAATVPRALGPLVLPRSTARVRRYTKVRDAAPCSNCSPSPGRAADGDPWAERGPRAIFQGSLVVSGF
jgi:hypothetical protein